MDCVAAREPSVTENPRSLDWVVVCRCKELPWLQEPSDGRSSTLPVHQPARVGDMLLACCVLGSAGNGVLCLQRFPVFSFNVKPLQTVQP